MSRADITLLNLNMLYFRFPLRVERETHVPLGPLYVARALLDSGYTVDFRDYQFGSYSEPFCVSNCVDFLSGSADIVGISVMANLLPFAVLVADGVKAARPETTIILGGVGAKAVEARILELFPSIDIVAYGECDRAVPVLLESLLRGRDLASCPNIFYRCESGIRQTGPAPRISDLDQIRFPAYELVDLSMYDALNVVTSRGCPFRCAFCSVAPIWNHEARLRSCGSVVEEIEYLRRSTGRDNFLFQDEYFLASPDRARRFARALRTARLNLQWKAFGRVNLIDQAAMRAMAESGCVALRFGVESGSQRVLDRVAKGFTPSQALRVVSLARRVVPAVDAFFVWGFPFETMDDFYRTVSLMNALRITGVRILPSLLSYLPQTKVYQEVDHSRLEFSSEVLPEFVLTGHEFCTDDGVRMIDEHKPMFDLIQKHPDVFPGFFHFDVSNNVMPKLNVLREFGFYGRPNRTELERNGSATARTISLLH